MSNTIYCGSGKKIDSQYGVFRSITVCLSSLPKEHIFEYEGKKYIRLNVNDKREIDKYGKNVAVSIDTWKPNTNNDNRVSVENPEAEDDDLPF